MSTPSRLAVATLIMAFGATPAFAADTPNLGKDISEQDLAEWDINIQPTGLGLPPGSGNAAEGQKIYTAKCVGCHGLKGEGGLAPALIANHPIKGIDEGTLVMAGYLPFASTVFDEIRRAMPWQSPRSLTDDEVYALCAFILAGNGLIPQDQVLNATNLAQVPMPNRHGFIVRFPKLTPPFKAP
jgi:S-disulfanyl-L-cysteine oxidoreductase SoxD